MNVLRIPTEAKPPRMEPLARLPVFFALTGKRVVLAGGTASAAWKAELLSAAGAQVDVFAYDVSDELLALAASGRLLAIAGAVNARMPITASPILQKDITPDGGDYEIVRRAIEKISLDYRDQPSLETLAEEVGETPTGLQKLFTRWAGLSPKAFLQAVTLDHARKLLDSGMPLLEAYRHICQLFLRGILR